MTTSRRQARRDALFALYKSDLTERPPDLAEDADDYARRLVDEVSARAEELDAKITASAQGWTANRLGVVERNVLRIAIRELDAALVPREVAIDEAVTLAKRYASDEAGRLVNGILGAIVKEAA